MSSVIALGAARAALGRPAPDCVSTDSAGVTVYLFAARYVADGVAQDMYLWARDWEDAERDVEAIRAGLTLVAQRFSLHDEETPAPVLAIKADNGEADAEPDGRSLETRLALALAKCVDTTLMVVSEDGQPVNLRLGSFLPTLADEAAALLEEAGV